MGPISRTKLIVGNISYLMTDEQLENIAKEFGKIKSCIIPKRPNGKSKGMGIVEFENEEDALKFKNEKHEKEILNRLVYISYADETPRRHKPIEESSRRNRRRFSDYSDYDDRRPSPPRYRRSSERERDRFRGRDHDYDRYERDRGYRRRTDRDRDYDYPRYSGHRRSRSPIRSRNYSGNSSSQSSRDHSPK